VYYKNGAYEKAEEEYNKVLQHYPNDSDAHFKLGVIYYKMGVKYNNKRLIEKSLFKFLEVTSIDPKYSKAYFNLGTIFSSRGPYFDANKATFSFKKYLELEPQNSNREKIELWLSKYGTK
jgi:superkiller protein 3